jgi:hypothetical protein
MAASKRKFVEVEIAPFSGRSGISFTYSPGLPDDGRAPSGPPRPVYIYSIAPGSPAERASSQKNGKLCAGDKILTVQGLLVVPLDGSASLTISELRELEEKAAREGKAFRLKVARQALRVGTQTVSDSVSSATSVGQVADEPGRPVFIASVASSVTSGSASSGRLPFAFGYVVADVLFGVPIPLFVDPSIRRYASALQSQLPPEVLAGGFPPDLRWWSGCRPHRKTRTALARLSVATVAGLRGVFAALMRDLWFLLGDFLPAVRVS